MQIYYFVGEGIPNESSYTIDPIYITSEQLATGDFVTLQFPISGLDSSSHNKITALRVQVGNVESIHATEFGTITFDYIYLGLSEAKIATYSCTTCGDKKTFDEGTVAHSIVTSSANAATCTATGLTEGKYCSVCNEIIVA